MGHHPDKVVYGEGWCGLHRDHSMRMTGSNVASMFLVARCGGHWDDDAPVQGGMNVWVNSMAEVCRGA